MSRWAALKRSYGRCNFVNYDKACQALSRFKDCYGPNAVVIDAYPGVGEWSRAVNDAFKPKSHTILEPFVSYRKFLVESGMTSKYPFSLRTEDPFRWSTFTDLMAQGVIPTPRFADRTQIHPELLFTANLTNSQGEQLCVQYLNCISNQSWLQTFGRVRLLIWVRESTCRKIIARPGSKLRSRVSVQAESAAECKVLIGHVDSLREEAGYEDDAIIDIDDTPDLYPKMRKDSVCLLQFDPLEHQVENIDSFEYVIRMMMIAKTKPVKETLSLLGPGAAEDLGPKVSDLLQRTPGDLTLPEIMRITEAFELWPFKPEFLHDFYEEPIQVTNRDN